MGNKRYKDLQVWQEAMTLAELVYAKLAGFPRVELYGLADQLRRAVTSIPSNIAEGSGRDSDRDFLRFLVIARGSLFEVDTQLTLAERFHYMEYDQALARQFESVSKLLYALIIHLRCSLSKQTS